MKINLLEHILWQKLKKTSNFHDKSEYHPYVTVATIKDSMTKNYVLVSSVTTSMHFETRKLAG